MAKYFADANSFYRNFRKTFYAEHLFRLALHFCPQKSGTDLSAPLSSYLYRFDFLEIRHGISMSAEVDVLPLHVLHLAGKVQIVRIRPMLL